MQREVFNIDDVFLRIFVSLLSLFLSDQHVIFYSYISEVVHVDIVFEDFTLTTVEVTDSD